MKKRFSLVLICLLIFSMFACSAATPQTAEAVQAAVLTAAPEPTAEPVEEPAATLDPNTVIVFNDDVLESMIRAAINKPEGDVLVSDALNVTQLDLSMDGNDWSNPRIHNIEALKYFTNLNSLAMNWALQNNGNGVDLTPLSGLTNLESLLICCNDIRDVSPLKPLVNLRSLWIWGCRYISDISALSNMTNLLDLWIKGNSILDISPLANMKDLDRLFMEENLVTDLSPLAELTKLTSLLLSDNPVKDYSMLSDIYPNLVEKDFEPVAEPQPIVFKDAVLEQKIRAALDIPTGDITLEQTESVNKLLFGNQWQENVPDDIKVKDISALKYFPNLVALELQNNDVQSIDVLRIMPNLTYLDLSNSPIRDLTSLLYCPNLTHLNLSGCLCPSERLAPLASLNKLEWLDLSYINDIKNVDALSALASLKTLYLNGLPIDFSPLAGLTNLTTLYVTEPFPGKYEPDYSVLKDIYPNLTDKNFELPEN